MEPSYFYDRTLSLIAAISVVAAEPSYTLNMQMKATHTPLRETGLQYCWIALQQMYTTL